jgi:hypothetical protein
LFRAISLVACFALVALAGCGGAPGKSGTISGALTYLGGPADPSHPHGQTLHKQAGRVIVRDSRGHTVAAQRVRSGAMFRFQVTPSRYQLVLVTRGGQRVCPRAVRVREGQTTRANLTCGIP